MNNQVTDMLNKTGRMIALAERFASEGQMNLNKTLEAIAYAQMRRASWNYRPEITTQIMQSELAQCLGGGAIRTSCCIGNGKARIRRESWLRFTH